MINQPNNQENENNAEESACGSCSITSDGSTACNGAKLREDLLPLAEIQLWEREYSKNNREKTNDLWVIQVSFGAIPKSVKLPFRGTRPPLRGQKVVIKTDRGTEMAVCKNARVGTFSARRDFLFIRLANEADLKHYRHIEEEYSQREFFTCRKRIRELKLKMEVVKAEHLLGGEKIIFYFLAENRVDFRELVKDLAHELHSRIELKQIGPRDESRLLSDVQLCGNAAGACSQHFPGDIPPISTKMAKNQRALLGSSRLLGACGRLRCCLSFDNQMYLELNRDLPRRNAIVRTPEGQGVVQNTQALTQQVTVYLDKGERVTFPKDKIQVINKSPQNQENKKRPEEPARNLTKEQNNSGEKKVRERRPPKKH
jgi:cell fate regulator YaaT (PSP1 superfamily)